MSEHVAPEYEGTRPGPGEPGRAGAAQDVRRHLRRSPACEWKR